MQKALTIAMLAACAGLSPAVGPGGPAPRTAPAAPSPEAMLKSLGRGYQPCVEAARGGRIDWTRGEIISSGRAKVRGASARAVAMARRAARLIAARNAVLLISGLRVDPDGKFPDIRSGRISVEGVVRDFTQTGFEYDPIARTVTVTLCVPLYGADGVVRRIGVVTDRRASRWPWPEVRAPAERPGLIVIDARGTKFAPCLFPRLVARSGGRVFDSADVPGGMLPARAMAVYAVRRPPSAKAATRPASAPAARALTIRASVSRGRSNGSLVIDDEQLRKLASHPEARRLMKAGKLVILTSTTRK